MNFNDDFSELNVSCHDIKSPKSGESTPDL